MGFSFYADYGPAKGSHGKRPVKTYMANCQVDGRPRLRFSLETKDKSVARQRIAKLEREYENGVASPWDRTPRFRRKLVSEAVWEFVNWGGGAGRPWKEKTAATYKEILNRFVAMLPAGLTIDLVDHGHITEFVRRHELAAASQANYLRHLTRFFAWCSAEALIRSNPAKGIHATGGKGTLHGFLTREEYDRLRKTVEGASLESGHAFTRRKAAWLLPIIDFAVTTGLRAGEICALQVRDLDLATGFVSVRRAAGGTTKNEDQRRVYLPTPARNAVEVCLVGRELEPTSPVFPSMTGNVTTVDRISKVFRGFRALAGLPEAYHFHTLRHSFASWAVMGGMPIFKLGKIMGHRDLAATMIYAHLAPEAQRDDMARIFSDLTVGDSAIVREPAGEWAVTELADA